MVHALIEAQRSLKPNGILIDLRPSPKARQVGLGVDKNWKSLGAMRETFEEDYASNRAVEQVVRSGFFKLESTSTFKLDRVMDTLDDFRKMLSDFSVERLNNHLWLIEKIEKVQKETGTRKKITVRGPMVLNILRKP